MPWLTTDFRSKRGLANGDSSHAEIEMPKHETIVQREWDFSKRVGETMQCHTKRH